MQINGHLVLANGVGSGSETAFQTWKGGRGSMTAEGTWNGGSVQLQCQSRNGTTLAVAGVVLQENGIINFDLPPGQIKCSISGSANPIYCYAIGLHQ